MAVNAESINTLNNVVNGLSGSLTTLGSVAGNTGRQMVQGLSLDNLKAGLVAFNTGIYNTTQMMAGMGNSLTSVEQQFKQASAAFSTADQATRGFMLSMKDATSFINNFNNSTGGMIVSANRTSAEILKFEKQVKNTFRDAAPAAINDLMQVIERYPVLLDKITRKQAISGAAIATVWQQMGPTVGNTLARWNAGFDATNERTQSLRDMLNDLSMEAEKLQTKLMTGAGSSQIKGYLAALKGGVGALGSAGKIVGGAMDAMGPGTMGGALAGGVAATAIAQIPNMIRLLHRGFSDLTRSLDRNTASNNAQTGSRSYQTSGARWATAQREAITGAGGQRWAPGMGQGRGRDRWVEQNIGGQRLGFRVDENLNRIGLGRADAHLRAFGARVSPYAQAGGRLVGGVANLGMAGVGLATGMEMQKQGQVAGMEGMSAANIMSSSNQAKEKFGGAVGGAMQGAAVGAMFGPWGMAIGAATGGVWGFVNATKALAKAAKDAADALDRSFQNTRTAEGELDALRKQYRDAKTQEEKLSIGPALQQKTIEVRGMHADNALRQYSSIKTNMDDLTRKQDTVHLAKDYGTDADTTHTELRKRALAMLKNDESFKKTAIAKGWRAEDTKIEGGMKLGPGGKEVLEPDRVIEGKWTADDSAMMADPVFKGVYKAVLMAGDAKNAAVLAGKDSSKEYKDSVKTAADAAKLIAEVNKIMTTVLPKFERQNVEAQVRREQIATAGIQGRPGLLGNARAAAGYAAMDAQYNKEIAAQENILKAQKDMLAVKKGISGKDYEEQLTKVIQLEGQLTKLKREQINLDIQRRTLMAQQKVDVGGAMAKLAVMTTGNTGWWDKMLGKTTESPGGMGPGTRTGGHLFGRGAPQEAQVSELLAAQRGMAGLLQIAQQRFANPNKYDVSSEEMLKLPAEIANLRVSIREMGAAAVKARYEPGIMAAGTQVGITESWMQAGGALGILDAETETKWRTELISLDNQRLAALKDEMRALGFVNLSLEEQARIKREMTSIEIANAQRALAQKMQPMRFEEGRLGVVSAQQSLAMTMAGVFKAPPSVQMPIMMDQIKTQAALAANEYAKLLVLQQQSVKNTEAIYQQQIKVTQATESYYKAIDYARNSWEQMNTEAEFNAPSGDSGTISGMSSVSDYNLYGSGFYKNKYQSMPGSVSSTGSTVQPFNQMWGGMFGGALGSIPGLPQDMLNSVLGMGVSSGAANAFLTKALGAGNGVFNPGSTPTSTVSVWDEAATANKALANAAYSATDALYGLSGGGAVTTSTTPTAGTGGGAGGGVIGIGQDGSQRGNYLFGSPSKAEQMKDAAWLRDNLSGTASQVGAPAQVDANGGIMRLTPAGWMPVATGGEAGEIAAASGRTGGAGLSARDININNPANININTGAGTTMNTGAGQPATGAVAPTAAGGASAPNIASLTALQAARMVTAGKVDIATMNLAVMSQRLNEMEEKEKTIPQNAAYRVFGGLKHDVQTANYNYQYVKQQHAVALGEDNAAISAYQQEYLRQQKSTGTLATGTSGTSAAGGTLTGVSTINIVRPNVVNVGGGGSRGGLRGGGGGSQEGIGTAGTGSSPYGPVESRQPTPTPTRENGNERARILQGINTTELELTQLKLGELKQKQATPMSSFRLPDERGMPGGQISQADMKDMEHANEVRQLKQRILELQSTGSSASQRSGGFGFGGGAWRGGGFGGGQQANANSWRISYPGGAPMVNGMPGFGNGNEARIAAFLGETPKTQQYAVSHEPSSYTGNDGRQYFKGSMEYDAFKQANWGGNKLPSTAPSPTVSLPSNQQQEERFHPRGPEIRGLGDYPGGPAGLGGGDPVSNIRVGFDMVCSGFNDLSLDKIPNATTVVRTTA